MRHKYVNKEEINSLDTNLSYISSGANGHLIVRPPVDLRKLLTLPWRGLQRQSSMSPRGPPPTPDKLLQRNYGAIDCSPVGIRASTLRIPAAGYVAPRVVGPGAALSPRLSNPKALYILLHL